MIKFVSNLRQVGGFLLTPVSFINKTDCRDITEILLKVTLSTIKPQNEKIYFKIVFFFFDKIIWISVNGFGDVKNLLYSLCLLIVVCSFVLFVLAIVLSVLLRYRNPDCPFGIFKLFLYSLYILCAQCCQCLWIVRSCTFGFL